MNKHYGPKFILLGNYIPDGQESMRRYALNLEQDLKEQGVDVGIWLPPVVFGKKRKHSHTGLDKYRAYIDKYLVAPLALYLLRIKNIRFRPNYHICDHSNAPYRLYLPRTRTGITCHDVLAIRGALGYEDAYCPATGMGVVLQKWILRHLSQIPRIAAVSQFTLTQLKELATPKEDYNWSVIYNTFNAHFYPMPQAQATAVLAELKLPLDQSFILHVGSNLPRKNKGLLVDMLTHTKSFTGVVFLAGQPVNSKLTEVIRKNKMEHRIYEIVKPEHEALVALYSLCHAFVFPSFSEGFGWPIIEAQACGAPVITSALEPMREIGGTAALYANPQQALTFASALESLEDADLRQHHIDAGYQNIKRFDKSRIVNQFLDLYKA